jgi:predicted nucleotidyltransferase
MDKHEIKAKLLEAVKSYPHVSDIKSVAIFGSYVSGLPSDKSDIDVLIDFAPQAVVGFFKYVRIQRHLGEILGLKVDLVTPQALSKYIKTQVLQEAEIVYER